MAYSNPQQGSAAESAALRKEAGAYLKSLREYAKALKVNPAVMTKRLLSYYDPLTFDVLFVKK